MNLHPMLEHAIFLSQQGLKIIPLHSPTASGCSCGKDCGKSAGKHPIYPHWQSLATDDVAQVKQIWNQHPYANIGVPMGKINGLFALDIDGDEGNQTLQDWIYQDNFLPPTWQVTTGEGLQLWYKIPQGMSIPNSVKKIGNHVDLRGEGGQSVAPGSLHRKGRRYRWAPSRSPKDLKASYPPKWLLDKIEALTNEQSQNQRTKVQLQVKPPHPQKLEALTQGLDQFRAIIEGDRTFPSASERDLALADLLALNDWTDQEIAHFLAYHRQQLGEDLKHTLYYELTVGKARQWVKEKKNRQPSIQTISAFGSKEETHDETEANPIPLPEPTKAERFPVSLFPPKMKQFIEKAAKGLQVQPDFLGGFILATAGLAIGNSREIVPKPGWEQKANLWMCLIAPPGSAKSASLRLAFRPVLQRQEEDDYLYQCQEEEYKTAYREYEDEKARLKHKKKSLADLTEPKAPIPKNNYCSDATIEAIISIMQHNPRGIALYLDELSGWITSMCQYKGGKGNDLQHYLTLWSGETLKVNRAKDDGRSRTVYHPFFAALGNLPTDELKKIRFDTKNGFLDRFLFIFPEKRPLPAFTWAGVDLELEKMYADLIHQIYALSAPLDHKGKMIPQKVHFSEAAKPYYYDYLNRMREEMNAPDFDPDLIDIWSKMEIQLCRLTLIMHVLRWIERQTAKEFLVDETTMICAMELLEYFKASTKKVITALGQSKTDQRVLDAVYWIKKQGGQARKRDIQRQRLAGCKRASDVDRLFHDIVDFGYGKIVYDPPPSGKGRPAKKIVLYQT